ncbi:hypothetical protein F4678DRAFT_110252 [Xylaria arbuscula]|nr:hypothetical protein F4678DRAFT_110252 [Xylaria arbuscula]
MDMVKFILSQGGGIAGNHFNVSRFPAEGIQNSINPVWRTSISNALLGLLYNYENFTANYAIQDQMTDVLIPATKAITPGGGSSINEAGFRDPDWKTAFYGENYATPKSSKEKYDPTHV